MIEKINWKEELLNAATFNKTQWKVSGGYDQIEFIITNFN